MDLTLDADSRSSYKYVGPMVGTRSAATSNGSTTARGARPEWLAGQPSRLRPGAVVAVSVVAVVGLVGILQWNRSLIITGLVAGAIILMLNVVVITIVHWHRGNTEPDSTYSAAEDVVRMRSPSPSRPRRRLS